MDYLLTNPQKSIWLTEKVYSGTSINNISGYTYIDEDVEFNVLKKAINEVIKLNDSMRIKIKEGKDSYVQYFSEYSSFDIDIFELSSKQDIEKKALELAQIPFEVKNSLLFKFNLFRLPNKHGGFFLSAHHLIGDSWSLGLIVKDILRIYSELKNNAYVQKDSPSYINYINNEKEYINSDKYLKDKAYWDEIFRTVPEVATIPSIKGNNTHSYKSTREKFIIPNNEINKIKEFCTNNKISVYNFFMAIYSLYLGRVSNLDDFIIGTPILNRTNFEQKHTTGMFISTAPLRVNLNHDLSFAEFTKQISSSTMSLLRHQRYPYQAILEDLRKKDSNIPNLYNVVLSYQITKTFDEESGIKYSAEWLSNGTCADDLQIHLFDLNDQGSMTVAYEYKTDKYDNKDISDLHSRILTIINQIIENKDLLLKNIEIVTPEEKHKILYEFNNTKSDYPKDKTIVDLFEDQVTLKPNKPAIVFENNILTYQEFNNKANQLARYLEEEGVKPKDNVVILADKSIELYVSIMAILKLGALYVPIDSQYPEERIQKIIQDCKPKIVIVDQKYQKLVQNQKQCTIPFLNLEKYSNKNLGNNISPVQGAYIIYTSGSTGEPKGVIVPHRGVVRLVINTNYIEFKEDDRILQNIAIVFDASTFAIFGSFLNGLTLYPIPKEQLLDFTYLEKYIKENKINIINSTVSYFNKLIEHNPKIFEETRVVLIGGEEVLAKTVNIFRKNNPKSEIVNVYGPTENSNLSCCHIIKQNYEQSVPIGIPVSNSTCYILDKNQNLLPVKTPGEICVGGDGVAIGYLNKPTLTSEKFIQNPFGEGKLYKTGDLGYLRDDGTIQFLSRIDNQVKIRGFRIELKEIETKILEYKDIKECAVIIAENNTSKILIAYIGCNNQIDIKGLNSYLKAKLPTYMVPTKYICMKSLPLNINGKLDTKALKNFTDDVVKREIIPSRNNIDKLIVDTLKDIFSTTDVSINDSFFDLGGDSLSAISFSNKISNITECNISVQDVFEHPVIQELSDYISTISQKGNINTITKAKEMENYPLSSAQKRIYYSSNLDNNSTLYNTAGGIIIDKLLDLNKLETSFNTLINRHESLRTHFEIIDNEVVQIVDDHLDYQLTIYDANTADLNKLYTDFVKPFDLSKAPLFRTKLVKLENNKMLFLLDMHHIISDGTSVEILLRELCDLYNDNELTEKQIDYKDFTLWEKEQFDSKDFKSSKEYWVNQFKDEIPLLNMPTIYSRPSVQSFEGSNYHTTLSNEIFNKVNEVAKKLNITPYMLMLSCYYILLSKYTSQDDIVVGTPIVGRELPELSNVLGMFVNTLALRNKIDSSLSFEEFSNIIKNNCLNSFKNQSYPFDMLVKDLKINRDTSRNPLFDVMFVYQNNGYPEINFKDTKTEYFVPDNNISKFDLTLEVLPINNKYDLRFEYCTKLFDEEFIKRFSSHYINILNTILEDSEVKIANIDMLSLEEKNQILYDFNNTKLDYPKDKTIVDLFEEQVKKTPDNIAVVFEDKQFTYRELNEKANCLARFLITNNVGLGDIVGILLDKSLEMIVSILGILKIGATFLPIDVNYPNERIDYILRDSKSNILLTTQDLIHKANDTVQPLSVELDSNYLTQYDNNNLNINYDVNNIAYIMYTSGSTGNPKGVMVTHKNIVRLVKNNNFINYDADEHILQTGSIVFDACTFEIWGALLNGFKLFIMKKENLLDANILEKYLDENKITTLWLTAPLFNQLCESNPYMFKNVKKLLTGGDVLSPKHINLARRSNPNLTIINGYGPTENTTFSCCFTINKEYTSSIPIGKPISNSTGYIVNNDGNLCSIGVPGELWVGGDGVSSGYLNNEDLTTKKFINNPFGEGIVYKTGDLAKWLPDGNIEFIGRIDNQVKIRGFRIELNEINKKILENSSVKEAFTTIKTVDNSKYICSYIVTKKDFDLDSLRNYLSNFLPSYMIPTYFVKLNKLPINQNGKVDKNALPTDFSTFINIHSIKEASTDKEKLLLSLFKKVLNNDNIGVDDNFFEIGGDSLTAMKLQVEAISNDLNISYADIFKYCTVEALIKNISENRNVKTDYITEYDKYNSLISNNTLGKDIICPNTKVGNVLLTGFTGFLGAHILDSFIKKEQGKIYCLIRSKNNMSARERLFNVLHFYFENKYDMLVDDRIIVVEGDITLEKLGLSYQEYQNLGKCINTVIHSAALVKHYGIYKEFEKINVNGTQNIISFSKKFDLRLLHISTISVSGNNLAEGSNINNYFGREINYDETNFYIGQNLDNLYVRSKFEAEKLVLDAVKNGLEACILRMGNLTSRFSEGKFQQNHFENAFVNRFKSFLQIGVFPRNLLNLYCEFTPIDYCGDAIISIASHFNKDYTVFHLLNEKQVYLDRLFTMLNDIGIQTKLISEKEFSSTIQEILNDPLRRQSIEGIINDLTTDKKLVYKSEINIKSDFTKEFLFKCGFEWPYIDINYIRNYFKYLIDIGYFNTTIN